MDENCGHSFSWQLLHPRYWLTWLGMGLSVLLAICPVSVRHGLGRRVGAFIYHRNSKRRGVIHYNLNQAFPDLSEKEREAMGLASMQWYACALIDYSLLFFKPRAKLQRLMEVEGKEHIEQAIEQGQNVLLLLAHSAMLDFAPAALGYEFFLYGSYKSVSNPVLDWLMARSRCQSVKFVISREEGMMRLVRKLEPGRILIFLPDEDLGEQYSDFAPFFGVEKATLNTPARIARLKKAVSLPCYAWYDEKSKKYKITIGSPIEGFAGKDAIQSATHLNQSLEQLVKIAPEQYMWLMKIYKTRPNGEGNPYI